MLRHGVVLGDGRHQLRRQRAHLRPAAEQARHQRQQTDAEHVLCVPRAAAAEFHGLGERRELLLVQLEVRDEARQTVGVVACAELDVHRRRTHTHTYRHMQAQTIHMHQRRAYDSSA